MSEERAAGWDAGQSEQNGVTFDPIEWAIIGVIIAGCSLVAALKGQTDNARRHRALVKDQKARSRRRRIKLRRWREIELG